ncbi:hypothetical protein DFJ74DRAFT_683841 [Hyaloraphidium curvatum]|nr:hypothetical protein DFJ74DRAFT_683841 [Hyaloraphidium curvatum]
MRLFAIVAALALLGVGPAAARAPCNMPTTGVTAQNIVPGTANGTVARLEAAGIRLFNCSNGTAQPLSGGLVTVEGGALSPLYPELRANWSGIGIYPGDAAGNGVFVLNSTGPEGAFNLTLNYSTVVFVDSPTGQLTWARWNVFTVPAGVADRYGMDLGVRISTEGGAVPSNCSGAVNGVKEVPYEAVYDFYSCPKGSPAGRLVPGMVVAAMALLVTISLL